MPITPAHCIALKKFHSSAALCNALTYSTMQLATPTYPTSQFCAFLYSMVQSGACVMIDLVAPSFAPLFAVMHYCTLWRWTSVKCTHTGMHWFLICCTGDDIFSWESQVRMRPASNFASLWHLSITFSLHRSVKLFLYCCHWYMFIDIFWEGSFHALALFNQ